MWDVVLRHGTVVDGSGSPGFVGDVAVRDGAIARIAPGIEGRGAVELAADGLVVCPGFIDIHSHSDLSLASFPDAACILTQGVTTVVGGNCGLSAFPIGAGHRAELKQYLSPFLPTSSPLTWSWSDLAGFSRELQSCSPAVNVAPLVGQGSIRLAVMGFDPGEATADQPDRMLGLARQAFEAGAFGLSMGLLYPPGSYTGRRDLVELSRLAATYGGLLAVHVRNEGDRVEESVQEALDIATEAGVRLQLSHQKAVGKRNWGKARHNLEHILAARKEGLDVTLDLWPYVSGSTTVTALLPGWVLEGGTERAIRHLQDHTDCARIIDAVRSGEIEGEALIVLVGFEGIRLAEAPLAPQWEGLSLRQIMERRYTGEDPWKAFLDILVVLRLQATMIIWEELDEDEMWDLLRSPLSSVGSDSWATAPTAGGKLHPRTYGTFPRFLRKYVLDERLMSLEEGIRKVTSLPASRVGLSDRGVLAEGAVADITVFDPQTITDVGDFADPHHFATGIQHVLVGGTFAVRDGQLTPSRAGQVLKRGML
jgi:N-acyl-D-amino-acid deacylase